MRLTALMQRNRRTGGGRVVSRGASIPAPTGGWDAISPLANMPPDRAILFDNWVARTGYVELRAGHIELADTGTGQPVETIMAYHAANSLSDKLFAASAADFYEVSTGTPAAAGLALSNARWQYVNFTTTGGHFLWACNGADAARAFNGAAWVLPALTGITSSDIINVAIHKNRLWFTQKNSTKAAYLPVDSFQGAATQFELGGLFSLGGFLMAIATWSVDNGNGSDDNIVFISSKGQVAVYSGDPSATFTLIGVFAIGAPIGRRCLTKVGADVAVISIDGVLPISQALVIERSASIKVSLTANIQTVMAQSARDWKDNFGWQLTSYPRGTLAILNVPAAEGASQQQYVMNTVTGAWCRFLGMEANCWEVYQDRLFFGGNDGSVFEADRGGSDNGQAINVDFKQAFNYFKTRGNQKRWTMIRPLLTTDGQVTPGIGLNVDFRDDAEVVSPASSLSPSAMWDVAIWDVDVWPLLERSVTDWTSISGIGYCASIRMKASILSTGGDNLTPVLRVNGFDTTFESGAYI